MTATPGKTTHTPLPWEYDEDRRGRRRIFSGDKEIVRALSTHGTRRLSNAEIEANASLIVTAVNALHAIAPGRELELAEALPEIIDALRPFAAAADFVTKLDETDAAGMSVRSLRRARAILAKLNLTETKP